MMELALIIICASLAFVQFFPQQFAELVRTATVSPMNLLKYFGASAMVFLTLSFLPILAMNIYMRHFGFYAYEIFEREIYPVQILGANVFFNFVFLSISFFFSAIFWKFGGQGVRYFGAIVSFCMFVLFLAVACIERKYGLAGAIAFFTLTVGGYFAWWMWNGFEGKARWWFVPSIFALLIIALPVIFPVATVRVLQYSLAEMKVGNVDVELFDAIKPNPTANDPSIKGTLLLRTPEFYYVRPYDDKANVLIIASEHVVLKYRAPTRDD